MRDNADYPELLWECVNRVQWELYHLWPLMGTHKDDVHCTNPIYASKGVENCQKTCYTFPYTFLLFSHSITAYFSGFFFGIYLKWTGNLLLRKFIFREETRIVVSVNYVRSQFSYTQHPFYEVMWRIVRVGQMVQFIDCGFDEYIWHISQRPKGKIFTLPHSSTFCTTYYIRFCTFLSRNNYSVYVHY